MTLTSTNPTPPAASMSQPASVIPPAGNSELQPSAQPQNQSASAHTGEHKISGWHKAFETARSRHDQAGSNSPNSARSDKTAPAEAVKGDSSHDAGARAQARVKARAQHAAQLTVAFVMASAQPDTHATQARGSARRALASTPAHPGASAQALSDAADKALATNLAKYIDAGKAKPGPTPAERLSVLDKVSAEARAVSSGRPGAAGRTSAAGHTGVAADTGHDSAAQIALAPQRAFEHVPVHSVASSALRANATQSSNEPAPPGRKAQALGTDRSAAPGVEAASQAGTSHADVAKLATDRVAQVPAHAHQGASAFSQDGPSSGPAAAAAPAGSGGSNTLGAALPAPSAPANNTAPGQSARWVQIGNAQWLLSQHADGTSARIQIEPPALGKVHIQLQMRHNDVAQVSFTVVNEHAAQALQSGLAQLGAQLQRSGIQLAHASVSTGADSGNAPGGSFGQGQRDAQQPSARADGQSPLQRSEPRTTDTGVRAYA